MPTVGVSRSSRVASQVFWSPVSQVASAGRSVSQKYREQPTITVGMASTMNSHCQPAMPHTPSSFSSRPPSGAPSAVESGTAAMNTPTARAR